MFFSPQFLKLGLGFKENMNETDSSDYMANRKRKSEKEDEYSPVKKLFKGDDSDENEGETVKEVKTTTSKKRFGEKYMKNFGYKEGTGLGKYGNGIVEPVEASKQRGRRGLGFEPLDLKDAVARYDPTEEVILFDEEVIWLENHYDNSVNKQVLESWVHMGPPKTTVDENSYFCDSEIIRNVLSSKNAFNLISSKDFENGRRRSNPFELIQNAIFLNRAAMKMANMDAILDRMFTEPKDPFGESLVGPNELLYFADVCAGPGGFSEYVLFKKKWKAKGFGFTLKDDNDFVLESFWAGPPESFEPFYGVCQDGNVYRPENILSFRDHIMKYTDGKGVHFMMADGGFHIEEKKSEQELLSKKLYLCQCIVALYIVRTHGHFVVKLFDLFTEFSIGLVYLMYRSFREILILKPNTSRPANSERYLICKWKRDDCGDIADHLFEINKKVPEFDEKCPPTKMDVLELVPIKILLEDKRFFDYVKTSNERFAKRQVVSLLKIAAYCENQELLELKQKELRKTSLKKWEIPDEARAEPKKSDPRTKWSEIMKNTSLCDLNPDPKKNKLLSYDQFKTQITSKYSRYCQVLSGEESNNTCTFYMGLGRNSVHKFFGGKWVQLAPSELCLPANTLVYGELIKEYLGSGKGQRKISGFHIIDGVVLGGEDIRHLPFTERLHMCSLFAKSLYKETCPVRVKEHFMLADIQSLWDRLELKSIKSSSSSSLCIPLSPNCFYKATGIIFITDTKDPWSRYLSKTYNVMYFSDRTKPSCSIYVTDVEKKGLMKKIYADFEYSFRTRLIWWWDDKVVVHESQNCQPDPNKLQREHIMDFLST